MGWYGARALSRLLSAHGSFGGHGADMFVVGRWLLDDSSVGPGWYVSTYVARKHTS